MKQPNASREYNRDIQTKPNSRGTQINRGYDNHQRSWRGSGSGRGNPSMGRPPGRAKPATRSPRAR